MDVVVIDDLEGVRRGLAMLLAAAPGVRVVAQGADGLEALALVAASTPDVLVMDVDMPGLDGITATRTLRQGGATVPVVLLCLHGDDERRQVALAAGASAFVAKCDGPEALLAAVQAVTRPVPGQRGPGRGAEDDG